MPRPFHLAVLALAAAAAIVAACAPVSMPEVREGRQFFAANCVSCHGAGGQGNGPLAAGMQPPPANLATLARENGGAFPTARALSYIYGDPDQAHLARVMPQFGGAMANDTVPLDVDGVLTPTPRVLAALFAYLQSIQQ